MIVVKVRDRDIKAAPMGPVTSGSVSLPVSWHFSEEWDDLAKTAVFRVGNDGTEITVAVLEDMCLVPDELLVQANAGENLWIGVYGWDGEDDGEGNATIAMPTIWTYTRIQDGSQPSGIEPPEGTPGWSAQIQNATDEALRVAHGVAADAAEGDFDGISPAVTISSITHGHSVTITDRDHPTGQSFNVMDGASAYEQAVAGGYTGTEAQFNEELASFKELSDEMKEVAPFYAEYGVTTKAEIEAAINNKRQIYLNRGGGLGGVVAPYTGTFLYADIWGEGTGYRFARTNGNWQYVYELKSEWTYSIYDLTAPAQRAEEAAAQALIRMNSADASAQAAAGSATSAATSASEAAQSATNAASSATAASGSAANASTAATTAQGHATNAASSATAASGSATAAASSATAAGNAQTAAETAQSAAEDAQEAAEAVLASIPSDYTELSEDVSDLKSAKAPAIYDTAFGAIASFEDGADGLPLKQLTVNIEPVQAGTGDPSPDNVRPISGWAGCNISHSGADTSNPTVIPITFPTPDPGTVYGGTLDVVNKKLTVEYAGYTLDGSNMSGIDFGNTTSGISTFRMRLNGQYQFPALQISNTIIFNYLDEKPVNAQAAWSFERLTTGTVTSQQTMYLKIPESALTAQTIDGFAAYLSAHPLQVCYKLASPVVYDVTAAEITTLLGTNNIWADCGDVTVKYPADTFMAISSNINSTIDSSNRISATQINDVQKAEIKNAIPSVPLTRLEVDLPVAPSNLNTPSLQNIVSYTLYDNIEAYLGDTFGTASITKSVVLSSENEKIYGGSVDFANSKITKKYDSILLDGVTAGLKFTVSGSQYRLTNNKLSNAVNSYRCFASWLPPTVLRVNKANHFTYGHTSDFAALGFSSVDDLNAMIQQEPLLVIFELDAPDVIIFDDAKTVLPSSNMTAWCNIGTLSITYPSNFENSIKSVVEKNRTNTYPCGSISTLPSYKIPDAMYYNPTPYFYDILGNVHTGNAYYRTNGAGYDGKRYLYYCIGAGATEYGIRKFDTWQKEIVLTRNPENIGHCDTIAFIPAWCPGFDSGTVDRIYTTSYESTGTVRVFSAETLEYLTSFTTNNLVNSEYFTYVPILLFNQNRGKFVLSSQRTTIDGVPYITLSIASIDGTIEKCVRLKDAGTSCGFDADDNFIYMLKDMSSSDVMLILDWELNPVTMAPFSCYDYEPEALYHIGDTFFMVSNIDNRQGVHIWEYHCTNTFESTAPTFPLTGWNNSLIDSSSFADIEI